MPWQKQYNPDEVLENAMKAFWAYGYQGTSMSHLVRATGINRGSIYAAFEDKHGLFLCALEHYDRKYRSEHLQRMTESHAPRDAIIAVFENAAARSSLVSGQPPGCLLVNTALELSPHDDAVKRLATHGLLEVERFFNERLAAAQADGGGDCGLDTADTAKTLLGLFLGLRVLARAGSPQSTLDAITSQARTLIG